jgi:hypothetical protein
MIETSEPSKVVDVSKAPPQVLLDPEPTVSEIEQEPQGSDGVCFLYRAFFVQSLGYNLGMRTSCRLGTSRRAGGTIVMYGYRRQRLSAWT